MDNDRDSHSFGRYLQTIRLEKNISLEQVAEQTRIGVGNLLLVEQEDHEQLPAEVFVKGFLRSYAAAVGADGDEAVRRYEARLNVAQKIAQSENGAGRSETRSRWKLMIICGLFLGVIAVSVMVISLISRTPDSEKPAQLKPPAEQETPAVGQSSGGIALSSESKEKNTGKLSLLITAVEKTWIKVIIDEKESTEYNLNPGDELVLEAAKGYNLLIGNAGGLKITLNNKPVIVPGESGQVVIIHLP